MAQKVDLDMVEDFNPYETYYETHTWTISGEIKVPVGDDDFINPMFVFLPTGWTCKITKLRCKINSGTSATFSLKDDGVDVTGFTSINATTTVGTTSPTSQAIADNSVLAPVVSAVVGTPKNMSITVQLEFTKV